MEPIINKFNEFITGDIQKIPPEMVPFMLRDILHYTTEELDMLDFDTYNLAQYYAVATYMQRNMMALMIKLFGGENTSSKKNKNEFTFDIAQPEVEAWIKQEYERLDRETEMSMEES